MNQFTMTETFPHPKEKVFNAFAAPDKLVRWIAPMDEMGTTIEEFEFVTEGWFKIAFDLGGNILRLSGQFLSIEAHDRISFTWIWQDPAPHAGVESHVLVELSQTGANTCLTLTHTRLDAPGMLERHREGWQGSFFRLRRDFKELQI